MTDIIRQKKTAKLIAVLILLLLAAGILASAGRVYAEKEDGTVSFTIYHQDRDGKELADTQVFFGHPGDKPVVQSLDIDGYVPQAKQITMTLSSNEEENVFTFVYQTKLQALFDGGRSLKAAKGEDKEKKEEEPQMTVPADVLPKSENKKDEEEKKPTAKTFVPPFKRMGAKPLMEQMREIHADAMKWSFTTFEQYQALLLRRYNIEAGIENGDYIDDRIVMLGIDENGKNVTNKMNEIELGVKMLDQIKDRIYESEKMYRKEQKTRLEKLAVAAVDRCSSYKEYCDLMDRKGVYVVISWNKENEPFGVTYLDRVTHCAFKGSETKVDLAWLEKTVEDKGWSIEKDRLQALIEKRNAAPYRTTRFMKKTDVDPTPHAYKTRAVVQKEGSYLPMLRGVKGAQHSNYESKKKDALDHLEDLLDGTKQMGQGK